MKSDRLGYAGYLAVEGHVTLKDEPNIAICWKSNSLQRLHLIPNNTNTDFASFSFKLFVHPCSDGPINALSLSIPVAALDWIGFNDANS